MSTIKLKWKLPDAPTGRFRSFDKRGWPSATYKGTDKMAAMISCALAYNASLARDPVLHNGTLLELTVLLADYTRVEHGGSWKWRTLKQRFNTLAAAKDAAEKYLTDNAAFRPEEMQ